MSPNSVSFNCQNRGKTHSIGQYDRLENRANPFSVIDEYTVDRRDTHQSAGAVEDVCEQAYRAITVYGQRASEGFMGESAAQASVLAAGSVAAQVKGN